jgi:hypothetical protein
MWISTARYSTPKISPIVKPTLEFDAVRMLRNQANATAAISPPKRLYGRRHHA